MTDDDPTTCPKCKAPLKRIETCFEVTNTYVWNIQDREWEEIDVSYDGDMSISCMCTNNGCELFDREIHDFL